MMFGASYFQGEVTTLVPWSLKKTYFYNNATFADSTKKSQMLGYGSRGFNPSIGPMLKDIQL